MGACEWGRQKKSRLIGCGGDRRLLASFTTQLSHVDDVACAIALGAVDEEFRVACRRPVVSEVRSRRLVSLNDSIASVVDIELITAYLFLLWRLYCWRSKGILGDWGCRVKRRLHDNHGRMSSNDANDFFYLQSQYARKLD